jgi:hypothetical protein
VGQLWLVCGSVHRSYRERGHFLAIFRGKDFFQPAKQQRLDRIRSAAVELRYLLDLYAYRLGGRMVVEAQRQFTFDGWAFHSG